jgi:hypothetical protein
MVRQGEHLYTCPVQLQLLWAHTSFVPVRNGSCADVCRVLLQQQLVLVDVFLTPNTARNSPQCL